MTNIYIYIYIYINNIIKKYNKYDQNTENETKDMNNIIKL